MSANKSTATKLSKQTMDAITSVLGAIAKDLPALLPFMEAKVLKKYLEPVVEQVNDKKNETAIVRKINKELKEKGIAKPAKPTGYMTFGKKNRETIVQTLTKKNKAKPTPPQIMSAIGAEWKALDAKGQESYKPTSTEVKQFEKDLAVYEKAYAEACKKNGFVPKPKGSRSKANPDKPKKPQAVRICTEAIFASEGMIESYIELLQAEFPAQAEEIKYVDWESKDKADFTRVQKTVTALKTKCGKAKNDVNKFAEFFADELVEYKELNDAYESYKSEHPEEFKARAKAPAVAGANKPKSKGRQTKAHVLTDALFAREELRKSVEKALELMDDSGKSEGLADKFADMDWEDANNHGFVLECMKDLYKHERKEFTALVKSAEEVEEVSEDQEAEAEAIASEEPEAEEEPESPKKSKKSEKSPKKSKKSKKSSK